MGICAAKPDDPGLDDEFDLGAAGNLAESSTVRENHFQTRVIPVNTVSYYDAGVRM